MEDLRICSVVQNPENNNQKIIQANAIESWLKIENSSIFLTGEYPYSRQYAKFYREYSCNLILGFKMSRKIDGLPLLPDCIDAVQSMRNLTTPIMIINSDIVIKNIRQAIDLVNERGIKRYLIVGRRRNVELPKIDFNSSGHIDILKQAFHSGEYHKHTALDYHIYRGYSIVNIPTFQWGRCRWDNWMIWNAKRNSIPIIDATNIINAYHQNHPLNKGKKKHRRNKKLYQENTNQTSTLGVKDADIRL